MRRQSCASLTTNAYSVIEGGRTAVTMNHPKTAPIPIATMGFAVIPQVLPEFVVHAIAVLSRYNPYPITAPTAEPMILLSTFTINRLRDYNFCIVCVDLRSIAHRQLHQF
ncbi:MAG TPA: hypothetical protein EYP10_07090 [Armatimonadetes bacterium]|nr:hypothetical protein [Armatimonadota bacterium]